MAAQGKAFVGLELKYCEQCGGLWLRERGSTECYCGSCARFLREMPPRARDNRRRGGSGPLRRRLRKQYREPGPELAPVEYVLAQRRQEEVEAVSLEAAAEQEAGAYEGR